MNAITLIKTDHKTVEGLFQQLEQLGDGDDKQKRRIVEKVIKELSVHSAIEEQIVYPAIRRLQGAEDQVLDALEEHHVVKWTLSELSKMTGKEERFDAKLHVLMESVRSHVEEEEQELLPLLREAMTRTELENLGQALVRAKRAAPTRPHPRSPDTPPGNVIAGVGAAMVDRARDAGRGLMTKAKSPRGRASTARRTTATTKTRTTRATSRA
jgi:hemerythrin superfamily protein